MRDSDQIEPFGQLLKRKRQALGWNQAELARRSGVARSYISQLEAERTLKDGATPQRPSREISDALAEVLGENRDYFRRLNGHATTDDQVIDDRIATDFASGLTRYKLLDDDAREFVLNQARGTIEFLLERRVDDTEPATKKSKKSR